MLLALRVYCVYQSIHVYTLTCTTKDTVVVFCQMHCPTVIRSYGAFNVRIVTNAVDRFHHSYVYDKINAENIEISQLK